MTPAQLLGEISRLVREAPCAHCGDPGAAHPPAFHPLAASARAGGPVVPAARAARDDHPSVSLLDEVTDDERWLWSLVTEAERVAAETPPAPDPRLAELAEERYTQACLLEQRISARIRAAEAALSRPSSWLRPSHRSAVARQLHEDRSAAVGAAVNRGRIEEVRHRLRAMAAYRADYLARHRTTLSAGHNARAELTRLVDDLIDGYARLPEPPVWFRYGLDFPPEPGMRQRWLIEARAAVQERRRFSWEAPR